MDANPIFGKRRARDSYDLLVVDVTRAINDADPVSLLEIGAPQDEYSPQVGTIVPRVTKAQSPAEVRTILDEEFQRWFGESGVRRSEAFNVPAERIWEALLIFRGQRPRVVARVVLTESHQSTGRTRHEIGGLPMPQPFELRVVRDPEGHGFYLLYCDAAGIEMTDTFHLALDDAFAQAEFEFQVRADDWARFTDVTGP
jgi:hypothetical protein